MLGQRYTAGDEVVLNHMTIYEMLGSMSYVWVSIHMKENDPFTEHATPFVLDCTHSLRRLRHQYGGDAVVSTAGGKFL